MWYHCSTLVISPDNDHMSLLFHRKTKTAIKWIWAVIAVVIIISMVFAFSGGSGNFF